MNNLEASSPLSGLSPIRKVFSRVSRVSSNLALKEQIGKQSCDRGNLLERRRALTLKKVAQIYVQTFEPFGGAPPRVAHILDPKIDFF